MNSFEHAIELNKQKARYYEFFNPQNDSNNDSHMDKPIAHFYGGNGFPVGVYAPLLEELSQHFAMSSLALQGYWYDLPTAKILTRKQDMNHLIEYLEKTQDKPVIGIGHSQGATATAMAAAKRPDLFSKLYLIDPVTVTKSQARLYGLIPRKLMMTQEPFKSTKIKQTEWDSVADYYAFLRKNRVFKRISDTHLRLFAQNSLIKKDTDKEGIGYELLFSPQQELANYFGLPYINQALKQLNKTTVPYHMILGKPSVFNSSKVRKSWQGIVPNQNIITLADYGHLLPMEAPEICGELIANLYYNQL